MVKKSQLKKEIEENGSTKMPLFVRNGEEWQQTIEMVDVDSVKEMEEYLKTYSEIKNYIKENFTSTINQVYCNSLNAMIDAGHDFAKLLERFRNDRPLTIDQRTARVVNDNDIDWTVEENLKTIFWAIDSHKQSKKYKPAKEVNDLLNYKQKRVDYIIPQITPNGTIAVKPSKTKISVLTIGLSSEDGKKLKELLLVDEYFKDKSKLLEEFFYNAEMLAEDNKNFDVANMRGHFFDLLTVSSKLFDMNLGKILKGASRDVHTGTSENDSASEPLEEENRTVVLTMNSDDLQSAPVVIFIPREQFCNEKYGNKFDATGDEFKYSIDEAQVKTNNDGVVEVRPVENKSDSEAEEQLGK